MGTTVTEQTERLSQLSAGRGAGARACGRQPFLWFPQEGAGGGGRCGRFEPFQGLWAVGAVPVCLGPALGD